jgi:hypothetical protein
MHPRWSIQNTQMRQNDYRVNHRVQAARCPVASLGGHISRRLRDSEEALCIIGVAVSGAFLIFGV